MKEGLAILFLLFGVCTGLAQDINYKLVDSLDNMWKTNAMHTLDTATQATDRAMALIEMGNYYKYKKPDSGLYYCYKGLALSNEIKFGLGQARALLLIGITQLVLGNEHKALQVNHQAAKIVEENNLIFEKATHKFQLGMVNVMTKNYPNALRLFKEQRHVFDSLRIHDFAVNAQSVIAETYLLMNQLDSALYHNELAHKVIQTNDSIFPWVKHVVLFNEGRIQHKLGNTLLALSYFKESLQMAGEFDQIIKSYIAIARIYQQINKPDSSRYFAEKSLDIAQERGFYSGIIDSNVLLAEIYEKLDPQKAIRYSKAALAYKDSLSNLSKTAAFETFTDFEEQERQREIDAAQAEFKNRLRMNAILGSTFTLFVIAILLFRNNRLKQRSKQKIEKAYDQLKSTQSQLIQSEKMASLGELTAGIAHEIQNPLNFVNNFSELNEELLSEMNEEIEKGNFEVAKSLAGNVINNQEKISQHGKRADTIVKGMLQHSRSSSGIQEPTMINTLVDEYVRLAYHGQRAKDKSFNVTLKANLDEGIGLINIVPQDIGRVILNLLNNAFYAVSEKKKQVGDAYEPIVSISTRKSGDNVLISVQDNGIGIEAKVIDKVFQPFFTTKPTGQGTGLGLSLSYDIVKTHSGTIKINASQNEGSEFVVELPVG